MTQPFKYGTLLYRASIDGFTTKAFHDLCDNLPNTVTIIRNSLYFVFGGFTSARWSSTLGSISDSAIATYTAPTYPSGSTYTTFLTGGNKNWLTTEIEVYQIFK
jgi:hypothetical protein